MIRGEIAVESSALSADRISEVLRRRPTRAEHRSAPRRAPDLPARESHVWILDLPTSDPHFGSPDGFSASLVGLGEECAKNLAQLTAQGCTVTVTIVQEIVNPEEDRLSIGIELTAAALSWLGASRASLVVDQYLG